MPACSPRNRCKAMFHVACDRLAHHLKTGLHQQVRKTATHPRITTSIGHCPFDATPPLAMAGIVDAPVLVRIGDDQATARAQDAPNFRQCPAGSSQNPSVLTHTAASNSSQANGRALAFARS